MQDSSCFSPNGSTRYRYNAWCEVECNLLRSEDMAQPKMPGEKERPFLFNVVMLSPHSDDIALSLGAFLRRRDSALYVRIVTVFSVTNNTADDLISSPYIVTSMRKGEDASFGVAVGPGVALSWLDREDAPLRLQIHDEAVFSFDLSYLDLNEVRHVVDKVKVEYGSCDLLFAPMALGQHIDHLVVRNAALELLSEGFAVVFYEDIPYAADFSLSEIDEHVVQLGALAGQGLELCIIETGVAIEEKIALLSCYRSQMDSRTESRVRSYAERCGGNSVVERVWVPKLSLPKLQCILKSSTL